MRRCVRCSVAVLTVLLAVGIAACGKASTAGSSGSSGSSGGVKAASTGPLPSSGCGSFRAGTLLDPDGVVAGLPRVYRTNYAGYVLKTVKSAWADWKPKHKPPYTIGIQWAAVNTTWQAEVTARLKAELAKLPNVGHVILETTGNNSDVSQGLQLFNSLLNRGVDLIVTEPLIGASYIGAVARARQRGVPVITALGPVDDPGAVNIDYNGYIASAETMARAAQMIGGKGNVLYGAGIAGVGPDVQALRGYKAAVANCPGLTTLGTIYSGYVASVAKSETLKFLATHPQPVNLVFTAAPFVPGMLQAFQQTGRPIPPAVDLGATKGLLGYWNQHKATYHAIGVGITAPSYAEAIVNVAEGLLAGRGPRVNNFVTRAPVINDGNLAQWVQPGWSLDTPGQPDGPPDSFMPKTYIDGLFTRPASG